MEIRSDELTKYIVIVVAVVLVILMLFKIIKKIKKCYIASKSTEEIRLLKKAIIDSSNVENERDIKFYRNKDSDYYAICRGKKFNIPNVQIREMIDRAIEYKETGFDGSIITKIDISMRGNEIIYKSSDIDLYSKDFLSLKTEIARECYMHDLKKILPCDVVIEQTSVKAYEAKVGNNLFLSLRGQALKRIVDNQICVENFEDNDNNECCINIKLIYNCVINDKYWYDVTVK